MSQHLLNKVGIILSVILLLIAIGTFCGAANNVYLVGVTDAAGAEAVHHLQRGMVFLLWSFGSFALCTICAFGALAFRGRPVTVASPAQRISNN
ncbi:hypothetical protein MHW98_05340 [Winkia sp. ACRQY]|uniref:hypothetical protein n=1 Tax=unclassified Winkia TaxID=2692119 RepID=UPI001EF2EBE8|nr:MULTISPECIES: hypothetical protein [unclassified Winkia]MCG7302749.1 hypothetical protein [Winkia sp. ACRQY]MDK7905938.1 hypothetical protein [Winkia sp. UMB0889B]